MTFISSKPNARIKHIYGNVRWFLVKTIYLFFYIHTNILSVSLEGFRFSSKNYLFSSHIPNIIYRSSLDELSSIRQELQDKLQELKVYHQERICLIRFNKTFRISIILILRSIFYSDHILLYFIHLKLQFYLTYSL